jgi:hypothetical protein
MRVAKWLAAGLLLAGCVFVWDDARLMIHNGSSSVITEVRLGDQHLGWWGPNLLGDPLVPGEVAISRSIDCGTYDVEVTRSNGDRCTVARISICQADRDLSISSGMMLGCGP